MSFSPPTHSEAAFETVIEVPQLLEQLDFVAKPVIMSLVDPPSLYSLGSMRHCGGCFFKG